MRSRIYTTSEKAWTGMISAIDAAQSSVYLEMYIFAHTPHEFDFIRVLENASRRGLRVILVVDMIGSYGLNDDVIQRLRAAGVEVLFFSFFLRRTHRKILIVDNKVAFLGGVNIGTHYSSWKDLHIRVSGNVLKHILRSFARVYTECGGTDKVLKNTGRQSRILKTKLWFIERGVGRTQHVMRTYYKERIDKAKHSIVIVTPYLLPPRWLIAHIHQAILRGVSVEILLPEKTDYQYVNWLNRAYVSFLNGLGAKCYFAEGMNHAKAMLIDGEEGTIGSQNIDPLSFSWNMEAGVFFHEKEMVDRLSSIIKKWKEKSVLFVPEKYKFHWYDIVIASLLRLFGFLPLW